MEFSRAMNEVGMLLVCIDHMQIGSLPISVPNTGVLGVIAPGTVRERALSTMVPELSRRVYPAQQTIAEFQRRNSKMRNFINALTRTLVTLITAFLLVAPAAAQTPVAAPSAEAAALTAQLAEQARKQRATDARQNRRLTAVEVKNREQDTKLADHDRQIGAVATTADDARNGVARIESRGTRGRKLALFTLVSLVWLAMAGFLGRAGITGTTRFIVWLLGELVLVVLFWLTPSLLAFIDTF